MKKTLLLASLAAALGAAAPAFAQQVPMWTHDGGFVAIDADATGVYATKAGIPYVPPENYGYGAVHPVATVKLDPNGAEVWYRQHPGFDPGHDIYNFAGDIAVGPDGDVFHEFTEQCVNGFHSNGVVLHYGAAGDLSWAARYYVGGYNFPFAIAVDPFGNSYLAVWYMVGGWGVPYVYYAAIEKYDPSGATVGVPTIDLPFPFSQEYRSPFDVAVDANQDVFVTGVGGTLKYDGTTFALVWSSEFVGGQVVAAGDGGAYVTGPNGTARVAATGETLWLVTAPGVQLVAANGGVIVTDGATTVQYAADGTIAWTLPVGGSDLAYDGDAFVYLLSGGVISKYGLDKDGDGYAPPLDCSEGDPSSHPGAIEVKLDGVDQDCNGYDLTIVTTKAVYREGADQLRVEATSALNDMAALTLSGYGPMSWEPLDGKWVINVKPAGGNPGVVTVQGVEGADFPVSVH